MVENPKHEHEIAHMLEFYCAMDGVESWHLDAERRINIEGSITIRPNRITIRPNRLSQPRLPLKFGEISGAFIVRECGLDTLEGAPYHVGSSFYAQHNNLQDLEHGPLWVGKDYFVNHNPLKSLAHVHHVGRSFVLSYAPDLPLPRCVMFQHVLWSIISKTNPPSTIMDIVDKYVGKGKHVMLNFALELKQAGYAGNARW